VIECAMASDNLIPAHQRAALGLLDPAMTYRRTGCTVAGAVQ
jgi:hypothetical protein